MKSAADLQRALSEVEYIRILKSTLKYLDTEPGRKLLKILYYSMGGNV